MIDPLSIILIAVGSYLYGSIPFGYLIALVLHRIDIRKEGSGNIGATNITRILGIQWGIVAFILDASKALLPFLIASVLFPAMAYQYRDVLLLLVGFSVIGHDFSIFLHFKGGKGMSTLFGLIFIFDFQIALLMAVVWVVVLLITGYVSFASLLAVVFMLVWMCIFLPQIWIILFAIVITLITFWQHRENIKRLLNHSEKVMFTHNFLGNKNG